MKFIDKIIESPSDNNIYWLWNPEIKKYLHLINLSYNDSIIKYYSYNNTIKDILNYYDKKNKYPSLFIFILPTLDISFYRMIIEIKDGMISYKNKIISYDIPHLFVIANMEPVPLMITTHTFAKFYMSH